MLEYKALSLRMEAQPQHRNNRDNITYGEYDKKRKYIT